MKLLERTTSRRTALVGGVVAALAWASRPLFKSARAQQVAPALTAVKVSQVPTEPDDPAWSNAVAATIPLNPQNLQLPRLKEAGAKSIDVRALYDSDRVAFLLEWLDAHRDTDLGTVLQYRDAVAIQMPEDAGSPPPIFTMGQEGKGVTIYHWKSDWQFGRLYDVDEAYPNMYGDLYQFSGVAAGEIPEASDYLTSGRKEFLTAAAVGNALADPQAQKTLGPVQKMRAEGFGTIEPGETQDGEGKGLFRDGSWRILVSVPRRQAKYTLEEGDLIPLSFAVWDGSRDERNGQKAYSQRGWDLMSMGEPAPRASATPILSPTAVIGETPDGGGILVPLLGSVGGLVVSAVAAVFGFRLWRTRHPRRQ